MKPYAAHAGRRIAGGPGALGVEPLAESRRTPVCKVAAMLIRSGGMDPCEAEATMMPWAEGDPALENHIEKAVEYLHGYSSAAGETEAVTLLLDLSSSTRRTMFDMVQDGMLFQEVEPTRARRLLRGLDIPTSRTHPHLVRPAPG